MIGPGLNGSPDFIQRIDSAGGKPAAGLFPRNYWTPGRKESAQARARRLARQIPKASVQYLLDHLSKRLRNVVGLNVRQPSSNVPPFRALQWQYNATATTSSGDNTLAIVFRTGQTVAAEGVRGVMSHMDFFAYTTDQNAIFSPAQIRGRLLKNGAIVPGYESMFPGMTIREDTTDATGSDGRGSNIPSPPVLVPVKLDPGDTLSFIATRSGAVAVEVLLRVGGWFYPIEVEGDGILGTMADRGSGAGSGGGLRDW